MTPEQTSGGEGKLPDEKRDKTGRGFRKITFTEDNGGACSIQKSSAAEDDFLWFGFEEIGLKRFVPGEGWKDVTLEQNAPYGVTHQANTRMHLSRDTVKALLPILRHFVKTGDLP